MKERRPNPSTEPADSPLEAERLARMAACYRSSRPDPAAIRAGISRLALHEVRREQRRRVKPWVVAVAAVFGASFAVAAVKKLQPIVNRGEPNVSTGMLATAPTSSARPGKPRTSNAPALEAAPATAPPTPDTSPTPAESAAPETSAPEAPARSEPLGTANSDRPRNRSERPNSAPMTSAELWKRAAAALERGDRETADRALAELERTPGRSAEAAELARAQVWIARGRPELAEPVLQRLAGNASNNVVRQRARELLRKP